MTTASSLRKAQRGKMQAPKNAASRATSQPLQTHGPAANAGEQQYAAKELDSKEIVLNSAQALIMEHGFLGLSMRELARHSGVAKGTIYHHFQDKRQIYLTVLERDILQVRRYLDDIVSEPGTFVEKLRRLVQTYFDLQRERRLVIMSALRENATLDDQFSEILKKYRSELLQPIGALIRQGMASGDVRTVHVEMAVLSILGILQGFVVHQMILEDADLDESVVDHIVDLLTHAFLNPGTLHDAGLSS